MGRRKADAQLAEQLRTQGPPPGKAGAWATRIGIRGHRTFGGRVDEGMGGFFERWVPKGDWRDFVDVTAWAQRIATDPVLSENQPLLPVHDGPSAQPLKEDHMTQRSRSQSAGVTIGMGSGIGGSLGIVFALLSGIELPLGLIFGAALGVLVGLLLELISSSAGWLLNEMPHRQDGSQSTTQARSEVSQMSKAVITRLFIGGLVAAIAGFVIALFAALAAFAGSELIMKGPDVVGIRGTPFAWSMVGLVVIGGLAMIGGAVAGLVRGSVRC